VTTAEINYRERCVRGFEWRVQRKARLEEDARNYQLQLDREERERRQRLEQARIDQLLNEAASLRRATDIRAYVDAVNAAVRREAASNSSDAIQRWSVWALAESDRIDPVKTARFSRACRSMTTQNKRGVKCGAFDRRSILCNNIRYLHDLLAEGVSAGCFCPAR
jgi:hypothetical protein